MDEREKQIADQMEEVRILKEEAQKELKEQNKLKQELQEKWNEMLAQAKDDVHMKREEWLREARSKIDEEQKNWREIISKQRIAFLRDLRYLSGEQICLLSRKILADLANVKLEDQLIENFLVQLQKLSKEEKDNFIKFVLRDEGRVWVNSSFQLNQEKESQIKKAIEEIIPDKVKINFIVSPELICGIEMRTEGKKISWNVNNYLDSLEEKLKNAFSEFNFSELEIEKKEE